MYVCLSKAMYGTLKEELIYYRKLSKYLREYGFVINPYKTCVANKWKDKGQLALLWHANDMKVSHKNKEDMKEIYGEKCQLQEARKINTSE